MHYLLINFSALLCSSVTVLTVFSVRDTGVITNSVRTAEVEAEVAQSV